MYRYLKVEPPSRRYRAEDVVYVDLAQHPIDHLRAAKRLGLEGPTKCNDPLTWEDLDNEALAAEPDPGTDEGRQKAMDRLHEQAGEMIVELLNFVQSATGAEVSPESAFQLVETRDDGHVKELTFVGERIEVYVRVQTDTSAIVDLYWPKDKTLPVEIGGDEEVPHKPGRNPLFVHAVDPAAAFEIVRRDYDVAGDDADWFALSGL